jgi:hypothetical protein
MNILITEAQYNKLTEEKIREFLYKFWNTQKKSGEEPFLDDMLYRILDITKESVRDGEIIRPIWYEYNGGYEKLLQQIRDEILHDEIQIVGDRNLDMIIFVDDVHSYGEKEFGGLVDIACRVVGGTVHGYDYNEDTETFVDVPNMDIFEQYSLLDYDTDHFVDFLKEECKTYFEEKLKKYGIPIYIDLMVK